MGVLIQTTAFLYIFPSLLGVAVSTRVGNELGANRPAKARTAMTVAVALAALLSFIPMGFTLTVRHWWGRMFTQNVEILSLVSSTLPIVGVCELANWTQTTACGVLRSSARPSSAVHINLGSFYLIGTPVALTLCFVYMKFEFVGLWLGMLSAQVSCLIFMLSVLVRTDWIVEAERAKDLTAEPQQIHILCQQEKEQCIYRTLYIQYEETTVQPLLTVVCL
ncbi:hypothetical protein SUGI_0301410 [Cryptomeria japonica]|nr:hypothetical protein SUGI_0301410 [Cryptomeria japonica]